MKKMLKNCSDRKALCGILVVTHLILVILLVVNLYVVVHNKCHIDKLQEEFERTHKIEATE